MEKYVENYGVYHHKLTGGGKFGESEKKKFLSALTEEVNAMGFSIRTEKQIDQKIRDELKAVKKYASALKSEQSKTGGGMAVLPRMTRTQKFVFEALENKPRITGTHGGQEIGSNAEVWNTKRRMWHEDAPVLEPQETTPKPVKVPRKEREEDTKRAQDARQQLVDTELRNAKLRTENLLLEKHVWDLKLSYWREKHRLLHSSTTV